ncbi:hypothetical protein SD71_09830 [Cohnella kolymensis]|uniref:Uncharacterized protein n=1 Tax=Cohnella kolymensis TaxID=1590652 RepID=A0ABR5A5B7_9BACL|nr:hypothetical protein [Cohnella kolymensis]KIL36229.1 hypothetical protein SD71_09830 [Cohnella kolymensis]
MPLEKNNLVNAADADPETRLENDNSKDLQLVNENNAADAEDNRLADAITKMADKHEYIDEP